MPGHVQIEALVPCHFALVRWRYERARRNVIDAGGFRGSAPVFVLDGHTLLMDCLHHVRAAFDAGASTVTCHAAPPPADPIGLRDLLPHHVALRGLADLPVVESDSHHHAIVGRLRQQVFRDRHRTFFVPAAGDDPGTVGHS